MDSLSIPFNGTLKRHWRGRQYRRLDGTISNRKKVKIISLGGRPRRLWRIRAVPKLHYSKIATSPLKLWSKLKNAYINMMLNLAGNFSSLNDGDFFRGKQISKDCRVPAASSKDQYESRLVFEIFKTLMASKELGTTINIEGRTTTS